jgi:hypothetical protein
MRRRLGAAGALAGFGLSAAMVLLPATAALAHAERHVGPYTVAIGFGTEPAYVGFPNSIEVIVHRTASGEAIDTAADTLKATVAFGSASMPVILEPNVDPDAGGSPGDYRGAFIPTSPGDYTFHITGAIGSTSVDESVTSSPTTFASVADPQTIQFPTKVPSSTELATKLDRQTARIQAEAAALTSANDAASSAKTFGIVGIVLGLTGIVVGGVALARARRRGPA